MGRWQARQCVLTAENAREERLSEAMVVNGAEDEEHEWRKWVVG